MTFFPNHHSDEVSIVPHLHPSLFALSPMTGLHKTLSFFFLAYKHNSPLVERGKAPPPPPLSPPGLFQCQGSQGGRVSEGRRREEEAKEINKSQQSDPLPKEVQGFSGYATVPWEVVGGEKCPTTCTFSSLSCFCLNCLHLVLTHLLNIFFLFKQSTIIKKHFTPQKIDKIHQHTSKITIRPSDH